MLTGFTLPVQTFMMAVEPNNTDLPDTSPGPTDDGYIAVAEKSIPQDPFCCSGPNKDEIGQSPSPRLNTLSCRPDWNS